ncbi:AAA-ATPase vps4-associated 1 domain protein [Fusarium beomiforme]|uniref:AAA-ATPase vps4-associated 1 domain protein n=1 Tax=Fusarium beomiforme TaxID=44412 RepID=A0A9P5AIB0_9HYPO|nr:AAA-ATPase vps4-associated 1 domain protein [Fusarium beomiforme]
MATTFPNLYTHRKVAETAAKACDICYKSSTSVLITPDQKDFFFVCPVHLKDRYFCTPKIDEEAAKKKREKELEEEKERVKKEYEEKMKKKKEKEEKKDKDKDKDKKDKDGDKEKQKEDKDEKKDEDKDKEDKSPAPEEEPRVFELKTTFYQQRLLKKRQAEAAKADRERASKPGFTIFRKPDSGCVKLPEFTEALMGGSCMLDSVASYQVESTACVTHSGECQVSQYQTSIANSTFSPTSP